MLARSARLNGRTPISADGPRTGPTRDGQHRTGQNRAGPLVGRSARQGRRSRRKSYSAHRTGGFLEEGLLRYRTSSTGRARVDERKLKVLQRNDVMSATLMVLIEHGGHAYNTRRHRDEISSTGSTDVTHHQTLPLPPPSFPNGKTPSIPGPPERHPRPPFSPRERHASGSYY